MQGPECVVIQTPVVDDRGQVVGTEPRSFFFVRRGQKTEVAVESGPAASAEERASARALGDMLAGGRGGEASRFVAAKNREERARLRKAWREERPSPHLQEATKAGLATGIANGVCALLAPPEELLADEVSFFFFFFSV